MARVNDSEVKAIIECESDDLSPFINGANIFVNNRLKTPGHVTDEITLKEIERWVAAHFIAIKEGELYGESFGGASENYLKPMVGKGLESTTFGQQAMVLDPSGMLGKTTGKVTAFGWMGTE